MSRYDISLAAEACIERQARAMCLLCRILFICANVPSCSGKRQTDDTMHRRSAALTAARKVCSSTKPSFYKYEGNSTTSDDRAAASSDITNISGATAASPTTNTPLYKASVMGNIKKGPQMNLIYVYHYGKPKRNEKLLHRFRTGP